MSDGLLWIVIGLLVIMNFLLFLGFKGLVDNIADVIDKFDAIIEKLNKVKKP
jgi:hypothetical protein